MEKLNRKQLNVSRGFTWNYYTSGAKDGKSTLLMIHGFPDTADEWEDVVADYLVPNGYGVIAVDCLGYGGSSKPTETKHYGVDILAKDLSEIVHKEGLNKVVSLGHDWGSIVAQRFYNFYPDLNSGLVLLNLAYTPPNPGQPFNLDGVLQLTESKFGYGFYHYWKLFTHPEGPSILDRRISNFWDCFHGAPETWLETLCKPDGVKNFLLQDKHQKTMLYATEARKQRWMKEFSHPPGFDAPLNYYRAMTTNIQDQAVANVPEEYYTIKVPLLFWGGQRDYVCRPELMQSSIDTGLVKDHTIKTVDSGHWAHLDKPKEFGETLIGWLKTKF